MRQSAVEHPSIRRRGCTVAVALVLLGVLAVPLNAMADDDEAREAGARRPVPSCPVAAALARAGAKTDAMKTYIGVIKLHPASRCAQAGIVKLRTKGTPSSNPCSVADALRTADQSGPSRTAYVEVLKADPTSECARTGLIELDAGAKSCATADALRDAEQTEAARAAYHAVLKADATSTCAAEGLDELEAGTTIPSRAANLLDDVGGWLTTLLGYAALILGIAAAAFLLLVFFKKAREWIVQWKCIDQLLAPRLKLRDIDNAGVDPAIGNGVMALEREYLARTTAEPGTRTDHYHIGRIDGQEDLTGVVQGVQELGSPGKILGSVIQLVERLLPRARFTASATLQKEGSRGAGLTILLEGARKPLGVTLWSGAHEDAAPNGSADRYLSLAVPAAAWIDYQVREALGQKTPVVTEDALSYALLQGGIESERRGDPAGARRFYRDALAADPWNEAALLNLANLHARAEERYPFAIRLLEQTVAVTRNQP